MKIFIFQNAPVPYRTPLFKKLKEHYDIMVVYGVERAGDRYWDPALGGYPHHLLRGRNFRFRGKILTYAKGLRRYLRDNDFDLYFISDDWRSVLSSYSVAKWARRREKPLIMWCGAIDTPYRRTAMISKPIMAIHHTFMKFLIRHVDVFLAYGPKTVEFYARRYRISEDRFIWGTQAAVPDASPTIPKLAEIGEIITFLSIGYLEHRKGFQDLITAAAQMTRRDFKLVIAGKGTYEARLRDMAKDDPRVEFVGYVEGEDKRRCFLAADVIVSPTYHDPWANTLNEACIYGLPIITTPAEGAEGSLAIHGLNALIVPPGDIDKLRGALEFFLENKSAIPAMGKKSKALAEKFNIGWVVENFARAVQIALRDKQDD
jgi:glycosyltransferase involved in cell wall biosynthesis